MQLRDLSRRMAGVQCLGGLTQIGRVLRHVRNEAASAPVRALVYVETESQKGIVVGKGGAVIKAIGTAARRSGSIVTSPPSE